MHFWSNESILGEHEISFKTFILLILKIWMSVNACLSDKALNETLDRVLQSGHFDRVQPHQNGVCSEEEEQTVAVEVSEAEEHTPNTGKKKN